MLDLMNAQEMEVGREQLTLKMNYPRSLQVWNVTKQSKTAPEAPKSTEESAAPEEDAENKPGE